MNIMNLEPRLQEYLQRKDFFDKNNLDMELLEKQYMITNKDKDKINSYFNKNIYKKKDLERNNFCDFVEIQKEKPKFESDKFRQDKRFQRLQNKVEMERAAQENRSDISELSRNYDLFNNGIGTIQGKGEYDRVFPSESKSLLEQPYNPHIYEQPSSHIKPTIQYNQKIYNNKYNSFSPHKPSLDNIIGNMNSYNNKVNKTYEFNSDSHSFSPRFNINNCKKEDMNNMYKNIEDMTGGDLRNIDIETYIKFGSPTSRAKSLGFENPVEHHFSYIDSDIQNPVHVVNDRPILSRLSNKQNVNYKERKNY